MQRLREGVSDINDRPDAARVERFRHLAGSLNEHVEYYRTHHAARKNPPCAK